MQNRDIDSQAGPKNNELEDDLIIKFAEEVLAVPDDDIFELDDDKNLNAENDEIIDLTEVAETKLQSDDDILDLTEDIEIGSGNEEELLELEDLPEEPTDTEETLSEIIDGDDDLTLLDDAVLDLDDVVEEISAVEQDIFAQEDEIDDEGSIKSAEFMSTAEVEAFDTLTSNDTEEEILLDFNDDPTDEDAVEEVEIAGDLDERPNEAPIVGGPKEKLELTETDRRILEEELSLDTDEGMDAVLIDGENADKVKDTADPVEDETDQSLADTPDPTEDNPAENAMPPATEEITLNGSDILALEDDITETMDTKLDRDLAESLPDIPLEAGQSQTVDEDHDRIDVDSDIESDDSEPAVDEALETDDPIDEFNFDFDDTTAQPDAEANNGELPPLTAEEELSVEALLAEVDSPENLELSNTVETGHEDPELDDQSDEKSVEVMPSDEIQPAADIDMDFDQADATDDNDLHKTADPILIRVKEQATPNHADESTLLNSVFEPDPEVGNLSSEQLEAVVERAVNKIFSERIEAILFDAIDRAVTKEIGRLKTLILGDADQND